MVRFLAGLAISEQEEHRRPTLAASTRTRVEVQTLARTNGVWGMSKYWPHPQRVVNE